MRLSFLGANYEAHLPEVKADGVEEIGSYRGAPMRRKHFKVHPTHHGRVQLTYRGVKYSQDV